MKTQQPALEWRSSRQRWIVVGLAALSALFGTATGAHAQTPITLGNLNADGRLGMLSRPTVGAAGFVQAADDFTIAQSITINSFTFTGLLVGPGSASSLSLAEIDLFSAQPGVSPVVTKPSDTPLNALSSGQFSFSTTTLNPSLTLGNSVASVNAPPNTTTGGNGPITGQLVQITATLSSPLTLAAGTYYVSPLVADSAANTSWYWASAAAPTNLTQDSEAWIRDSDSAGWHQVGREVIGGANRYNAVFTVNGVTGSNNAVPEPGTFALAASGLLPLAGMVVRRRRHRK